MKHGEILLVRRRGMSAIKPVYTGEVASVPISFGWS